MKLKKKLQLYKRIKKEQLKEWGLKLKNKIIFLLKSEIEKKNQFIKKGIKNFKKIRIKIDIKNKNNVLIGWWNWKE